MSTLFVFLSKLDSHRKGAKGAWFDKLTMIGIPRSPWPVEGREAGKGKGFRYREFGPILEQTRWLFLYLCAFRPLGGKHKTVNLCVLGVFAVNLILEAVEAVRSSIASMTEKGAVASREEGMD